MELEQKIQMAWIWIRSEKEETGKNTLQLKHLLALALCPKYFHADNLQTVSRTKLSRFIKVIKVSKNKMTIIRNGL